MSEVKICPTCGSEYPMSERFCPRDGSALRGQNAQGDLVGTVIADRYHVMKKLGEGGMGAVYLAEHVKMGRKSAIKVMNPGMNQDPDAIARFNREASNASRMNHPNICAIYDFGETPEGLIYLAMEFIEGQSLTSLIEKSGSLPPARAGSILHQTADALQVAHDYGIVHRDLKPDNIMIAKGRDNTDLVKVVDFGIAKASTSDAQKVTKTGLVVGTPEYMSPEQLSGDKLDGRSDIYSLGLVGFNMLTGTLPFPSNSAQEAMIMRLTDQPKKLAEMKPDVAWPDELQRVMDKALARDVTERYQKAADFGREFAMAIEAMPATAAAEAGTMVIGAQSAAASSAPTAAIPKTRLAGAAEKTPSKAEPAATPVKSNRGVMIGVSVAVVAVLSVGGYFVLKGGGTRPPVAGADSTNKSVPSGQTASNPASNPADSKGKPSNQTPAGKSDSKPQEFKAPAGGGAGGGQPAGPSVASVIDAVNKVASDPKLDEPAARKALQDIANALDRAQGDDAAKLYFLQIVFFDHLGQEDRACRAAQNALSNGIKGADRESAQTYLSTTATCKK